MEETKKIAIPDEVVNPKAYLKYVALAKHPLLNNHYTETSTGEEVNLGIATHHFKRYIAHLAPKEQEILLALKTKYNSLLMKRGAAKSAAFGTKRGKKKNQYSAFEGDVIELLGRMFSIAEVVRIMGEDNEVVVTEEQVKDVLKKNIVEIERKRDVFRNKVADVRLFNKRPRLEELTWMFSKMKMRYIALNSTEAYNAMLRTLEQLRKESEGEIVNINAALDVNINAEINAHIQKDILKTINIKEIILGRIAARMNYDMGKLVAGLHNSFYHKFVQISGDFDPDEEMQYPSLINYDYNEIERRNAEINDVVEIKAEPVDDVEKEKAQSVKDLFLKRIREQRKKTEARTSAYTEELNIERPEPSDEIESMSDYDRYGKRGQYAYAKDKVPPSKTKGTGKLL